jgi:mono/diheme cytochrome c family protein
MLPLHCRLEIASMNLAPTPPNPRQSAAPMHSLRFASAPLTLFALTAFATADEPVDYVRDIKPMLRQQCISCHGTKVAKGRLRLDTVDAAIQGGSSGPAIVAGQSAKSLLIDAVKGINDATPMPFKAKALTAQQIELLSAWIDQGAKHPSEKPDVNPMDHWAFKAPVRPATPAVKGATWIKNPIDAFILAQLEAAKISPSPEADKVTLLRRVYLDLLGLPPTLEVVDAFVADTAPDAYEKIVDRLLASPHYGERWARHWLDQARYADTHGFTIDAPREIWKYRDWVLEALNRDLPFDQFVVEQMAGDMLPDATLAEKIATGFHRNTLINEEGGIDKEQFRVEAVADRVNTTATVFLGLTLACARCHDHKYDPLTTQEYYQIFAFLNNQSEPTLSLASPEVVAERERVRSRINMIEADLHPKLKAFAVNLSDADKAKMPKGLNAILNLSPEQRTPGQRQTLSNYFKQHAEFKAAFEELDALTKAEPKFPTTLVLQELTKPRETFIQIGGDFTRKGTKVAPGVPAILHHLEGSKAPNRLDLACWLVGRKNPLLARVTVNRLWQQYFGKGLVETENDFGTQGSPPSHPELLDWLAVEFMDGGWSLRKVHRLIVTSAVYRQSSKVRPELREIDADNKLLARQTRLRLDAEIVRDNALAVSGLLSHHLGGPSVYPPQPEGIYQFTQVHRAWKVSGGADRYRRGLYTFLQRSAPYPALTVFDAPDGTSSCTRRIRSNTPLQALTLLNDMAYLELARGLAARSLRDGPADDSKRVAWMFRLCLGRQPSPAEASRLEAFLQQQLTGFGGAPQDAQALLLAGTPKGTAAPKDADLVRWAAWTAYARVLLNLDEFITRE